MSDKIYSIVKADIRKEVMPLKKLRKKIKKSILLGICKVLLIRYINVI